MLTVENLHAHYGRAHILQGVSFALRASEVFVLAGRNGAGKSTTIKSLIGLVRPSGGAIVFNGKNIAGEPPYKIARAGLGYVPEERRIFASLTVMENLETGRQPPRSGQAPWTPDRLFALFPNLAEMRARLGGRMSGGEQQMLAIARTLMGNPSFVLLDEPSEGLAPIVVEQMAGALRALKAEGVTILLAEQNLHFAEGIADRVAILEQGRIAWSGAIDALDPATRARHLGV